MKPCPDCESPGGYHAATCPQITLTLLPVPPKHPHTPGLSPGEPGVSVNPEAPAVSRLDGAVSSGQVASPAESRTGSQRQDGAGAPVVQLWPCDFNNAWYAEPCDGCTCSPSTVEGLTSWTDAPTVEEWADSQDEDDRRDYDLKGE